MKKKLTCCLNILINTARELIDEEYLLKFITKNVILE